MFQWFGVLPIEETNYSASESHIIFVVFLFYRKTKNTQATT